MALNIDKLLRQTLKLLPDYVIEIGVFVDKKEREEAQIGVNNAELLFIHENGAPSRNIPSRPILDHTIKWAMNGPLQTALQRAAISYLTNNCSVDAFERDLNIFCEQVAAHARETLYNNTGGFVPESLAVQRVKGKKAGVAQISHPLFDTGQLARSISCRLVKK